MFSFKYLHVILLSVNHAIFQWTGEEVEDTPKMMQTARMYRSPVR